MKKVRFLQGYRGKLTAEVFFAEGAEDVFEDKTADALIAAKRAISVEKPKPSKNKATK